MARKVRDLEKEAHWRKVVARQEHSGETVRRYCQEHGLSESAFWYWKRELARRAHENGSGLREGSPERQRPGGRRLRAVRAAGSLVPVTIDATLHGESAAWRSAIEVTLSSGARLRVSAGCDAATLRMVLAALETA